MEMRFCKALETDMMIAAFPIIVVVACGVILFSFRSLWLIIKDSQCVLLFEALTTGAAKKFRAF